MLRVPSGSSLELFLPPSESLLLGQGQEPLPFSVRRLLTEEGSYYFQVDSAGDRGKAKNGGKMNEEISSDSESER